MFKWSVYESDNRVYKVSRLKFFSFSLSSSFSLDIHPCMAKTQLLLGLEQEGAKKVLTLCVSSFLAARFYQLTSLVDLVMAKRKCRQLLLSLHGLASRDTGVNADTHMTSIVEV